MDTDTKVCSRCDTPKPTDDFYVKDKRTGRRYTWCKACHSQRTTANSIQRRRGDAPPLTPSHYYRDRRRTEKMCSRCKAVFPIEAFALLNAETGKRRGACPDCHNASTHEYKLAHPEIVKAQRDDYYARNRAAIVERQRRFRVDNPEAYRAIHRKWKARNTAAVNAATHRRRARIRGAIGSWTAAEWEALKAECDHRCLMCGLPEPEIVLTVDHIVPVSLGGTNTIDNLQPLCRPCNSKKHQKVIDLRS